MLAIWPAALKLCDIIQSTAMYHTMQTAVTATLFITHNPAHSSSTATTQFGIKGGAVLPASNRERRRAWLHDLAALLHSTTLQTLYATRADARCHLLQVHTLLYCIPLAHLHAQH